MKNLPTKFLILSLILAPHILTSFAGVNPISSSTEDVQISLPLKKDDFLIFYGLTENKAKNTQITDLRNDFMLKFKDLKDEYTASFDKVVDGYDLVSSIPEYTEDTVSTTSTIDNKVDSSLNSETVISNSKTLSDDKTSTSVDVNLQKAPSAETIKKYIIQNTKDSISPIVNILGNKINIKTESSSWFQKIKSWFGW